MAVWASRKSRSAAASSSASIDVSTSSVAEMVAHATIRRAKSAQIPSRSRRAQRIRALWFKADGQGHREADPPALPDLLPDGGAPAGHRARHQAGRRGLQRNERGRLRAALLRRPRRAGVAAHPADRREAARRRRRAGELLAATGELPPSGDRILRLGARRARDGAVAARRRVRLRRAAAPRAAADHVGAAEPASAAPDQRGVALGITASGRRPRALADRWRRSRPRSSATRRSPSTTTRWSATRPARASSTPTTCSSAAASSTCSATAHEREALRVFRLSRIRGKVAYATKAEHDFRRPADFDPRAYANLARVAVRRDRRHAPRSASPSGSPGSSSAISVATARSARSRAAATACSSPTTRTSAS